MDAAYKVVRVQLYGDFMHVITDSLGCERVGGTPAYRDSKREEAQTLADLLNAAHAAGRAQEQLFRECQAREVTA